MKDSSFGSMTGDGRGNGNTQHIEPPENPLRNYASYYLSLSKNVLPLIFWSHSCLHFICLFSLSRAGEVTCLPKLFYNEIIRLEPFLNVRVRHLLEKNQLQKKYVEL
jgi:hypothetical protein